MCFNFDQFLKFPSLKGSRVRVFQVEPRDTPNNNPMDPLKMHGFSKFGISGYPDKKRFQDMLMSLFGHWHEPWNPFLVKNGMLIHYGLWNNPPIYNGKCSSPPKKNQPTNPWGWTGIPWNFKNQVLPKLSRDKNTRLTRSVPWVAPQLLALVAT